MNSEDCRALVRLTPLERAYGAVAPWVFRAAQGCQYLAGASSEELRSRCGLVPVAADTTVWFHGASAGEMSAALAFDSMLQERGFGFTAVYSAANRAGVEYVRRLRPDCTAAVLAPWDTRQTLGRVFARWRPQMIFIVETELWPRLIYEAALREIPVFCVSGRIYPRDVKRYRAIRTFITPTLRRLTRIIAQDEIEQRRFQEIGAPEEACYSGGNLKYLKTSAPVTRQNLRAEFGLSCNEPVVVVGSLHKDEIAGLMAALVRLKILRVRMLIAPRHLSAVEYILAEAGKWGWRARRRSEQLRTDWQLMVLDTIGELQLFYSIATCAIVGGGFGRHGGHNPFEPVLAGAPVLFGPHFENFQSEARALAAATPEACVADMKQLVELLTQWLGNDSARAEVHRLQGAAVPDGNAIADRYLEVLAPWLSAMHA